MSWISRLVNAFRPERAASDLDEELRFHLDERIEELVRNGIPRRDAERAARLKFGGALQVRESTQEVRSAPWVESLAADFRFGLRMLRKHRNATLAAVASLALAIGACTAAFALLDALVFRPLPQDDPMQRCPDITLAKKTLGWEPKVKLEDGLTKTIAYFDALLSGRLEKAPA